MLGFHFVARKRGPSQEFEEWPASKKERSDFSMASFKSNSDVCIIGRSPSPLLGGTVGGPNRAASVQVR